MILKSIFSSRKKLKMFQPLRGGVTLSHPPILDIIQRHITGSIASSGYRIASGMTTLKQNQLATPCSDTRSLSPDILVFLP